MVLTLEALRDTIFIGHANPEDDEFTKWLGLQLASHGYKVPSDILIGITIGAIACLSS